MVAACQAEEFQVTALAKSLVGTSATTSEDEAGPRKARATPNTTRIANIRKGVMRPIPLSVIRNAHIAARTIDRPMISRRPTGRRPCRHQHQQRQGQELNQPDRPV
jgi:hypothetical protein